MTERVNIIIRARDSASRVFGGVRNRLRRLRRAVFSLQGAFLVLAGVRVLRAMRGVLDAFSVQQDAVNELRATLILTGRDGENALNRLRKSAAELQKVTRKGDEEILSATAAVAQLARELRPDELMQVQRAVVGIAETFFKGDLANAALILGKSLSSTTNALTRYGIQVDVSKGQSERLAEVMQQSNLFFQVAAARAGTISGKLSQLKNSFGDLKEGVGAFLGESEGFNRFVSGLQGFVGNIATALRGQEEDLKRLFAALGDIASQSFVKVFGAGVARMLDAIPLLERALIRPFENMAARATLIIEQSILDIQGIAENTTPRDPGGADITRPGTTSVGQRVASRLFVGRNRPLPSIISGRRDVGGFLDTPERRRPNVAADLPAANLRILQAAVASAEEHTRRLAERMQQLKDSLAKSEQQARINAERMEFAVVGSLQTMASAAVSGAQTMESAMVGAITNILRALPGVGILGGGVIGIAGGLLSGLLNRRRDTVQPVSIQDVSETAADKMADRRDIPASEGVIFIGAGASPAELQAALDERRRNGVVDRFGRVDL